MRYHQHVISLVNHTESQVKSAVDTKYMPDLIHSQFFNKIMLFLFQIHMIQQ